MVSYKLDKIDKMFIAFMFVVVTIASICNLCFAAEIEDVEVIRANVSIADNRNYFVSTDSGTTGYFQVEKGYIYHITNLSNSYERIVAISNETPANNVEYQIIAHIESSGTYDYIANSDTTLFISYNSQSQASVTREKIENMNGAIGDLVSNVGVNQFWNVFENGVDFVGLVVLVGFGIFLVVLAIRKVQKGKSDY